MQLVRLTWLTQGMTESQGTQDYQVSLVLALVNRLLDQFNFMVLPLLQLRKSGRYLSQLALALILVLNTGEQPILVGY